MNKRKFNIEIGNENENQNIKENRIKTNFNRTCNLQNLPSVLYTEIQSFLTILECQPLEILLSRNYPYGGYCLLIEEEKVIRMQSNRFIVISFRSFFIKEGEIIFDLLLHALQVSLFRCFFKDQSKKQKKVDENEEQKENNNISSNVKSQIVFHPPTFFKYLCMNKSKFNFNPKLVSEEATEKKIIWTKLTNYFELILDYLFFVEEKEWKPFSTGLYFWFKKMFHFDFFSRVYPKKFLDHPKNAIYLLPSREQLGRDLPSISLLLFIFKSSEVTKWERILQEEKERKGKGKETNTFKITTRLNKESQNILFNFIPPWLQLPHGIMRYKYFTEQEQKKNNEPQSDDRDDICLPFKLGYFELCIPFIIANRFEEKHISSIIQQCDCPKVLEFLENYFSLDLDEIIPPSPYNWNSRLLKYFLFLDPLYALSHFVDNFTFPDFYSFYIVWNSKLLFPLVFLHLWMKSISSMNDLKEKSIAIEKLFLIIPSNKDWMKVINKLSESRKENKEMISTIKKKKKNWKDKKTNIMNLKLNNETFKNALDSVAQNNIPSFTVALNELR